MYHSQQILQVSILSYLAFSEEGVDYPVPQRVDGELRNPQEILSGEVTLLLLVKA